MFPFNEELLSMGSGQPSFQVSVADVHANIGSLLTPERKVKIDEVATKRNYSNVVVLENIYDRGNASAVMRSAEALGFAQVHMIELAEKFKESQRTTAGADKWIEVKKWKSTRGFIDGIKAEKKRLVVTALGNRSKPISEVDFSGPTALVLGNEKDGASAEMIEAADECVLLPMVGFVQSYNISVAGALCFYHIYMDRLRRLGSSADVSEKQIRRIQAEYYVRTLDSAEEILRQMKERSAKA